MVEAGLVNSQTIFLHVYSIFNVELFSNRTFPDNIFLKLHVARFALRVFKITTMGAIFPLMSVESLSLVLCGLCVYENSFCAILITAAANC